MSLGNTNTVDFPRGARHGSEKSITTDRTTVANKRRAVGESSDTKISKKARKSSETKGKTKDKDTSAKQETRDVARIEHLNYKRLLDQTLLLVQVIRILPYELIVSLPNQLLGHVPITNISSAFTARLEESAALSSHSEEEEEDDDDDDDEDNDDERDVPKLEEMFFVGELLAGSVVSTKTKMELAQQSTVKQLRDEETRNAARVELSLDPDMVNSKLEKKDLMVGMPLSGSVKSIEDNGYIVNIGIKDCDAFTPFQRNQARNLEVGQVSPCVVESISKNGRTCSVSFQLSQSPLPTDSLPNIDALLPYTIVTCFITSVSNHGLNVKFYGIFDGTIDVFHLEKPAFSYKTGQKLKARIIWILPEQISCGRTFSLTTLPHLLHPQIDMIQEKAFKYPSGLILEDVEIIKVEPEWGLLCQLEDEQKAFVHISRVSDDRIEHLQTSSGPYSTGKSHRGRIVGFSSIDNLLQISFKPSVVNAMYYQATDLQVGQVMKVKVKKITDKALFVGLSDTLDGAIWPLHYSDVVLTKPEKKFKIDSSIKARVWSIDAQTNRVSLTVRKSLISSELPTPTTRQKVDVGTLFDSVITSVREKAIYVETFGRLKAMVPIHEVSEEFVKSLAEMFRIGEKVAVKIIRNEVQTPVMIASIRRAKDLDQDKEGKPVMEKKKTKHKEKESSDKREQTKSETEYNSEGIEDVVIGTNVSGTVTALHADNTVLKLDDTGFKAIISFKVLAKHLQATLEELREDLKEGTKLNDLVIAKKEPEKDLIIVGGKSNTDNAGMYISQAISVDRLVVGEVITAKVNNHFSWGIQVILSDNIKGMVPLTEFSDDYDSVKPEEDSEVQCKVLTIDSTTNQIRCSLRKSKIENKKSKTTKIKDPVVNNIKDLSVDKKIRGFVKNVADAGVFVQLGLDIDARIQIKDLSDDFIKDWKTSFKKGQLVSGKIKSIDENSEKVEMTLRQKEDSEKDKNGDVLRLKDFDRGKAVQCVVTRIETYGIFLRINGSNVSGLCHKSEIKDGDAKGWEVLYKKGDPVKALIISIDREEKRISFSVKPSRVASAVLEGDDEGVLEENQMNVDDESDDLHTDEQDEDAKMSASDDEDNDDDEDSENDEDSDDEETADESESEDIAIPSSKKVLAVGGKIDWDGKDMSDVEDQSDEEEEDEDEGIPSTNEISIEREGHDSPAKFEDRLKKSPSVAAIWISYLTYHVRLFEIAKARQIAERAIETINFREEKQKMLVWLALLGLENTYGTEETFKKVFDEAVQRNEPKHLQLRLIEALEKDGSIERAGEVLQRLTKKHGQSCKVWVQSAQFYMRQGNHTEARELLPRALQRLPARKHIKTTVKFAMLEYTLGDPERGRTIMEGVLDSYPKKLDLWRVYIDKEVQHQNIGVVRTLFDRVLQQNLSSVKTKNLLKKWLAIEKEHGDEKGAEAVKARAVSYVGQQSQKNT